LSAQERPTLPRRWIVIGALIVIVIALLTSARFYTDVLWFEEVGFTSVLWKSIRTQVVLGVVVGAIAAAVVWLNLWIAGRLIPMYRVSDFTVGRSDPLDRIRDVTRPFMNWIRVGVALFIGLSVGGTAAGTWRAYLLWTNRVDFGTTDPQFGRDIGFFVFELPFYQDVLSWLWFTLFAVLLLSAGAHFFFGSMRFDAGPAGVSPGALAHLSVLLGLLALVKSAQYWFGRFDLNFSPRGVVTGASYTDVHAQLPALNLLAIISIISAGLFIANIRFRRFSLPIAAVAIWILTSVLAGGVFPFLVQRFSVEPQELQRETPYIARNIKATREAFGLGDVDSRPFAAAADLTGEDIEANDVVVQNIRLWDPPVLQLAYEQLQAIRPYYKFPDVDVDRYEVDGGQRQVLISARELSLDDLSTETKNWQNQHLQFTHGYGVVASLANESTSAGQPDFLVKDLPGTVASGADSLQAEQPGLYYGESFQSTEYSVVNSKQEEVDFGTDEGVERSRYAGAGGVRVGNFFTKLAFAVRESDPNLVLSNLVTGDSRIMIYKNVRDRITRAAPFLALDHDPYVAIVEGKLFWILDAYTTTSSYPYSQRFDVGNIVTSAEPATLDGRVNYLRNSVKVAVDAYNGTMKFYVVDETDPLIRAWRNVFPDLFTEEEPPPELAEHFRYPEDLFKVQSDVYLTYHITDPADFFSKEDEWAVPENPQIMRSTLEAIPALVPPTYLLFGLPGEPEAEFLLTRPFTPRRRNNMIALLVARNDPEHYGELLTLQFPRQKLVSGPIQVDNLINQDVQISPQLTLLGQGGSEVDFGALVNLPIEDSILYIQPLYVTAENVGIPELKKVALVFGENAVMADNFEEALTELFGVTEEPPEEAPPKAPPQVPPGAPAELRELIERAADVYNRAQVALEAGDFSRYGELIEQLGRLLERAARLSEGS
jgi:uncharacterized membrane protein (UPF0182 family)